MVGLKPFALVIFEDEAREVIALQLNSGNVEWRSEPICVARIEPATRIFEHTLQHELADGHDQTTFLGDPDGSALALQSHTLDVSNAPRTSRATTRCVSISTIGW